MGLQDREAKLQGNAEKAQTEGAAGAAANDLAHTGAAPTPVAAPPPVQETPPEQPVPTEAEVPVEPTPEQPVEPTPDPVVEEIIEHIEKCEYPPEQLQQLKDDLIAKTGGEEPVQEAAAVATEEPTDTPTEPPTEAGDPVKDFWEFMAQYKVQPSKMYTQYVQQFNGDGKQVLRKLTQGAVSPFQGITYNNLSGINGFWEKGIQGLLTADDYRRMAEQFNTNSFGNGVGRPQKVQIPGEGEYAVKIPFVKQGSSYVRAVPPPSDKRLKRKIKRVEEDAELNGLLSRRG